MNRPTTALSSENYQPDARRRMPAMEGGRPFWILSVLSIVTLVVAWFLLCDVLKVIPTLYFPTMSATGQALSNLRWTLALDAGTTAWRVILSWVIGSTLGIAVGLAMVKSRALYYAVNPLIEGLRPVPPIALIPLMLLWFGLSNTGRIVLAALSCFMILVVTTVVAGRNVTPIYVRAAQALGAGPNRVFTTVILPAIVPQLVGAVRIAAALSWAVVVAAEYLGAQSGIGYLILQASHTVDTAVVVLGVITIGLEAFLLEQIIRLVSARLTRWVDRLQDI